MTDLAVQCALLGIAADPGRLYDGDDPFYELWLHEVVDRVAAAHREAGRGKG